jgi:hypothetical protein
MVAVPVVAPRVNEVAVPPMLRVVAVLLKTLAVVCVVVNDPPLTAILPADVTSPVDPETEKLVPVKLDVPRAIPVVM